MSISPGNKWLQNWR